MNDTLFSYGVLVMVLYLSMNKAVEKTFDLDGGLFSDNMNLKKFDEWMKKKINFLKIGFTFGSLFLRVFHFSTVYTLHI